MNSFFSTPVQQFTCRTHPLHKEDDGINLLPGTPNKQSISPDIVSEKRSNNFSSHQKDYKAFEKLYDDYAPKIFGFLILNCETKEQAEKYLMDIFLQVWDDIKNFNVDAEKKINRIVLINFRSFFKTARIQ